MTQFDDITAEFPSKFEDEKELAKEIRDILFGTGMLFVRTHDGDKKRNKVYSKAIQKIGRRSEDRRMKTQEVTFDLWWYRSWRRKGVFLVAETGIRRIGA